MKICPNCGNTLPSRALVCGQCHAAVANAIEVISDNQDKTLKFAQLNDTGSTRGETITPKPKVTHSRTEVLRQLNENQVAIFVGMGSAPLISTAAPSVILGRYSAASSSQPHIDLVPFGAYDKGVSRLHAMIHFDQGIFSLHDLGSSNGTWLHSKRLEQGIPLRLLSGDWIQLGQLYLQIHVGRPKSS